MLKHFEPGQELWNETAHISQLHPIFTADMPNFNWNDSVNFLTKLRPRRLWNATKVYSSYQITKLTGKPVQWGYPISISFEPTTSSIPMGRVNARSPLGHSGQRRLQEVVGSKEMEIG